MKKGFVIFLSLILLNALPGLGRQGEAPTTPKQTGGLFPVYLETSYRETGSINVDGWWGYVDNSGKVAIPVQFRAAGHFSEGLAPVKTTFKHGYINRQGEPIIAARFDNLGVFSATENRDKTGVGFNNKKSYLNHLENFNGLIIFQSGNKQGLVDRNDRIVIEPQFDEIGDASEGLAPVLIRSGHGFGKWGFIDQTGKVVIPPRFGKIRPFSEGLAAVAEEYSGGKYIKWGYIDKTGRYVIKPKFTNAGSFYGGVATVETSKYPGIDGKKVHLIDKKGHSITEKHFNSIEEFDANGLARVSVITWKENKGYAVYGYINRQGQIVIAPEYDHLDNFVEGVARMSVGGKWGFINQAGKTVVPPQYDEASFFIRELARVRLGNKQTLIDRTGQFIEAAPHVQEIRDLTEGLIAFKLGDKWGLIDGTVRVIVEPQFDDIRPASDELLMVRVGGKWGYANKQGQVVITPRFTEVGHFLEDRAVVSINRKWGYIDKTGEIIGTLRFDDAKPFSEGLAAVKVGSKWGYVDKTGQVAIKPQFYESGNFIGGLAHVITSSWGYINEAGKLVIKPQFDAAGIFSEGLARIKLDGKFGFIDESGKIVINPRFDEVGNFSDGLALARISDKYGYINSLGQVSIEPRFEAASSFSEGLAVVRIGTLYGYIDPTGYTVIEPQFAGAVSFSEGLARVKIDSKWGYIDKAGKFTIQPQFEDAGSFTEGLAEVKIGERWGYIDTAGKIIIKPQFSEADSFSQGLAGVKTRGRWGYVDKQGNFAVAPQYLSAKPFYKGVGVVTLLKSETDDDGQTFEWETWAYINSKGQMLAKQSEFQLYIGAGGKGIGPEHYYGNVEINLWSNPIGAIVYLIPLYDWENDSDITNDDRKLSRYRVPQGNTNVKTIQPEKVFKGVYVLDGSKILIDVDVYEEGSKSFGVDFRSNSCCSQ